MGIRPCKKRDAIMKRSALGSIVAAILLTVSLSGSAFAQGKPKKPAKEKEAAADTGAAKTKSYDFSGDDIDGDLVKPDGEFLDSRNFANRTSLIRIRSDFVREILKSAEDL
jgi:hypothetical protein